MDHDVRV